MATVEFVGLAVGVAALMAVAATAMGGGNGTRVGDAVGEVLDLAVRGGAGSGRAVAPHGRVVSTGGERTSPDGTTWSWWGSAKGESNSRAGDPALSSHATTETRHVVTSPGSLEVQAAGDHYGWSSTAGGVHQSATASWCAACAGGSVGFRPSLGGRADKRGVKDGVHDGISLELSTAAHVAAVQAQAAYAATAGIAGLTGTMRTTGRVVVGGDADGTVNAQLGRHDQHLVATGSAVAGARVRVEQQAGAKFAGAAVDATGGAEGWAGAGLTGSLEIAHKGGRFEVGARGGGALGVGGALDGKVVIDVSGLLKSANAHAATLFR